MTFHSKVNGSERLRKKEKISIFCITLRRIFVSILGVAWESPNPRVIRFLLERNFLTPSPPRASREEETRRGAFRVVRSPTDDREKEVGRKCVPVRKGISLVTGLFRRAWFVERFNARRGKKAETSAVVTARFPRLIRDKARTNGPLNAFARFARVNAVLPRFVSGYQNLSRFYAPFNISLVFRRNSSAAPSLVYVATFYPATANTIIQSGWKILRDTFAFSVCRDFEFQLFRALGAWFIRMRNSYRFVVALKIEDTY